MEVVLRVSVKGSTFFTTYAIMYHHSFLLERRAWLATFHMISEFGTKVYITRSANIFLTIIVTLKHKKH